MPLDGGIEIIGLISLLCKLIQFLMVALSVAVHKALILLDFFDHPYQSLVFPGFLEIIRVVRINHISTCHSERTNVSRGIFPSGKLYLVLVRSPTWWIPPLR